MTPTKTFWLVALLVFISDQITKCLAVFFLSPSSTRDLSFFLKYFTSLWKFPFVIPSENSSVEILGKFLKLTLTSNSGIAWGLFKGYPIPLGFLSVALSIVICWLFFRYGKSSPYLAIALGLILGGAVGNLVDRLRFLEVVDFIDVFIPVVNYDFPIFNTADSAASVGTVLIAIYFIRLDILAMRRKRLLFKYDLTIYR